MILQGADLQRPVDAGAAADPRPGAGVCFPSEGLSGAPGAASQGVRLHSFRVFVSVLIGCLVWREGWDS